MKKKIVVISIFILSIIGLTFFVMNKKDVNENSQTHQNQEIEVNDKELKYSKNIKLSSINSIRKQIELLNLIKPGDEIQIGKKKVIIPSEIQGLKDNENKNKVNNFIPQVDFDGYLNSNDLKYLDQYKVKKIQIQSPQVSDEEEIKLNWNENKELNSQSELFLKKYINDKNSICLSLEQTSSSIWNAKIPEIIRISFIENLIQRYKIHQVSLNFNSTLDSKILNIYLGDLKLIQKFLDEKGYDIDFNFNLPMEKDGIDASSIMQLNQILKYGLRINNFILNTESLKTNYYSNSLKTIVNSISKSKKIIQKSIDKQIGIKLNDSSLSQLIGFAPNISSLSKLQITKNMAQSLKRIAKAGHINTINMDSFNSDLRKSPTKTTYYYPLTFTQIFSKFNSNDPKNDKQIKLLLTRTSNINKKQWVENNLKLVDLGDEKIPEYENKTYIEGDKVIYKNHIFKFKNTNNKKLTNPKIGSKDDKSNWIDLGEVNKEDSKIKNNVKIKFIEHEGINQ